MPKRRELGAISLWLTERNVVAVVAVVVVVAAPSSVAAKLLLLHLLWLPLLWLSSSMGKLGNACVAATCGLLGAISM